MRYFGACCNFWGARRVDPFDVDRQCQRPSVHHRIPRVEGHENMVQSLRDIASGYPLHDSPEIFGLHSNADLTFGSQQAMHLLQTISVRTTP